MVWVFVKIYTRLVYLKRSAFLLSEVPQIFSQEIHWSSIIRKTDLLWEDRYIIHGKINRSSLRSSTYLSQKCQLPFLRSENSQMLSQKSIRSFLKNPQVFFRKIYRSLPEVLLVFSLKIHRYQEIHWSSVIRRTVLLWEEQYTVHGKINRSSLRKSTDQWPLPKRSTEFLSQYIHKSSLRGSTDIL